MTNARLCAALLLGFIAAGAAPLASPPPACEPGQQKPSFFKDEWISNKVAAKLQFNKALLREKIDVKTTAGVVTLSGNVTAKGQIALAGKLAAQVSGVRAVNNYLQVGPPLRDAFGRPGGSS